MAELVRLLRFHPLRRITAWADRRPRRAWAVAFLIVLLATGWEASFWPRHRYGGAIWHRHPRGVDIELGQERAAVAGWNEIAGFWHGPMLQGFAYYRPLTSCLFVAEYCLFGIDDARWAWVNLGLHLGAAAAILWAVTLLAAGPLSRRLATGTLASLLFAGPIAADRDVQYWIIGWWPCQSEILSLMFGALLLGEVAAFRRTRHRLPALLAPITFFLAIASKEMGYVAGLGACLLLLRPLREPDPGRDRQAPFDDPPDRAGPARRRTLLAALAIEGVLLYTLRWRAVGCSTGYNASHWRDWRVLSNLFCPALDTFRQHVPWSEIALLAACAVVGVALYLRAGPLMAVVCLAAYFLIGSVAFGLPWQEPFSTDNGLILASAVYLTLIAGVVIAMRSWPVPELVMVYLMSGWAVVGFPAHYGWYHYWLNAFGAILTAIGMVTLIGCGAQRLAPASAPQPPSR